MNILVQRALIIHYRRTNRIPNHRFLFLGLHDGALSSGLVMAIQQGIEWTVEYFYGG